MAKKKTEEKPRPKHHAFCFMEECKNYVDKKISEDMTIKVCNYCGHNISLGCLGVCPKNNITNTI